MVAAVTFTAFSIGTALAPNLAAYFVFRIMSALQGTCFLIVGSTVIGDIYRPIERGTAYGWFLSGTLIGACAGAVHWRHHRDLPELESDFLAAECTCRRGEYRSHLPRAGKRSTARGQENSRA